MLEGVDGVDRAAQLLGDLARREPGDQPQQHHLALVVGQRLERRAQAVEALAGLQLAVSPVAWTSARGTERCARRWSSAAFRATRSSQAAKGVALTGSG